MLSPRMAYVLLWFPLSSETFVFREIQQLVQRGMDIRVYTMYGEKLRGCSDEMKNYAGPIKRFGSVATLRLLKAFWRAWKRDRETVKTLMRRGLFRKMRNLEAYAENLWCFLAGFLLAEEAQRDGIELLHSSWGNGPATAVWVASRLSGIPFAFRTASWPKNRATPSSSAPTTWPTSPGSRASVPPDRRTRCTSSTTA